MYISWDVLPHGVNITCAGLGSDIEVSNGQGGMQQQFQRSEITTILKT